MWCVRTTSTRPPLSCLGPCLPAKDDSSLPSVAEGLGGRRVAKHFPPSLLEKTLLEFFLGWTPKTNYVKVY